MEITGNFDYIWNCTGTSDTIKVCADYMDDVAEIDETNNCQTETLSCKLANLKITDVWNNNSIIHYKIKMITIKFKCSFPPDYLKSR